jgi:uncharacterized delta-60 repeat protein
MGQYISATSCFPRVGRFFDRLTPYGYFTGIAHVIGALLLSAHGLAVPGQPGTLDATWAASSPLGPGKAITPVGSRSDFASALALQPDGKLVLAGGCSVNTYPYRDVCALRYNANGTLDTSFGANGKVIAPMDSGVGEAFALVLQPDGKLVLAGYCDGAPTDSDFCALRYNTNGTLDTSFGTDGKVITPVGSSGDIATALARQPDGKLVLAGHCQNNGTNYDFCALRYNANGTLDTSFGAGGKVITPVGSLNDYFGALALQPDDKLVLAGSCLVNGASSRFCAIRYNANGTLDTSFGTGGKVITPVSSYNDNAYALALQPDGKLVIAGSCRDDAYAYRDVCAIRYNANGTLDTSFGTGGKVIISVGSRNDFAHALVLQPDGKLVLAGVCPRAPINDYADQDFCALRYNANGTLDTSFGTGGIVTTPVGSRNDVAYAVALQPDGKLVLAGVCDVDKFGASDFCAIRYNANGTLDTSFNGDGKVITPVSSSNDYVNAIALQPDGKLVLAGECFNGADNDFCVIRYNATGTVDTSFGSDGKVVTPAGASYKEDRAQALALQPDGKLVLAGYCFGPGGNNDFCAIRYNANGTLDTSFGPLGTGIVITKVGSSADDARTIALQPDGKLVLAGSCRGTSNVDFCAVRLNANGTLDTSFGSAGTVITPVGSLADNARALVLQPDGKLVLAGFCQRSTTVSDFCAVRYNANGTLDTSFGSAGIVITPMGSGNDSANALVLQPDGKLVLAGFCKGTTNIDFCAIRYNANGAPDTSFGSAGIVITPVGSGNDSGNALALQPNGKLVLAGNCRGTTNENFCAVRYNANGTLDASFGSAGIAITPAGPGDSGARALALQPDGKLVLAGFCDGGTTKHDFCAIRYDGGPF